MTKVILFYPPVYYENGKPVIFDVSYPPLGILYLAAVLEKEGITVKAIDVGAEKQYLKESISLIKREKPLVIGISAMTSMLQGAVDLAKEIKDKLGDKVLVCLGGSHISADPRFIERIKYFDFGVCGEAEKTFTDLVKKVIAGQKVKGVFTGEPVKNLDMIPWPARKLINLKHYHERASLIATRGCPFHCYYCSRPAVSNLVRCRDPKDIVNEMEWLYSDCGGDYLFQDDSLTIRKDHALKLCEEIISRGKKFRWAGYTRIDLIDEELLRQMGKAGCYSLSFGIETGSDKIREKVINKCFTNKQIINVLSLCRKYRIEPDGFFMLGHPTETKKEIKQTVDFILNHNFNLIGLSIATPYPGSLLWDYAIRDKIIDNNFIDDYALGKKGKGYAGVYPVYTPKNLKTSWLYQQRKKVFRGYYLKPSYILHRLIRDFSSFSQLKADVCEAVNLILKGSSSRQPFQKLFKQKEND